VPSVSAVAADAVFDLPLTWQFFQTFCRLGRQGPGSRLLGLKVKLEGTRESAYLRQVNFKF